MIRRPSWTLAACLLLALPSQASPSVKIGMKAAFPAGPYLLELLETAAGENSSAYFPLLNRIASGHFATASTDADLYAEFVDVLHQDGHVTSPESLSTFNLALSLRLASPRIEAHYQFYSTAVDPVFPQAVDCATWVLAEGKRFCTPSLDESAEDEPALSYVSTQWLPPPVLQPPMSDTSHSQIKQLPFDRTFGHGRDVVLYADPTSASFGSFHKSLFEAAQRGIFRYRLRYLRHEDGISGPLPIGGFGVELALKRTDYIVIDDRASDSDSEQKKLSTAAIADGDEELADIVPLSTSELSSLGMKTASSILESKDKFGALLKLTQDLPKLSAFISRHNVSENFARAFTANQAQNLPPGINWLWMNGIQLIERQIEPIAMVELVRRERSLVDGVRQLGFSGKQAISFLSNGVISQAKRSSAMPRYDWSDRLEDRKAIIWLNNLEKDSRYAQYPKRLRSLLQPSYFSSIPPIARNIFTVVAPVDFTDAGDLGFITELIDLLYRGLPIRFGLVPITSDSQAAVRAKAAHHLMDAYGLSAVYAYVNSLKEAEGSVDEKLFDGAVEGRELLPEAEALRLTEITEDELFTERMKHAQHWITRLGAAKGPRFLLINGFIASRENNWMQPLGSLLSTEVERIQRLVYLETIHEDTLLEEVILEDSIAKRNRYITPEDDKDVYFVDINRLRADHADLLDRVPVLEAHADSSKENWAVGTVVADLTSKGGRQLAFSALEFRRHNPGVRLDIIHSPRLPHGASAVNAALKATQDTLGDIETIEELEGLIQEGSQALADDNHDKLLGELLEAVNIERGTRVFMINGRIVGPFDEDAEFDADDLQMLLEFEQKRRILPVYAALDTLGLAEKLSSPLAAAKLTSITALSTVSDLPEGIFESAPTDRTDIFDGWQAEHCAFEVGDKETASIQIVGLLNPVSEQGQRWAPILKVLSELDGVHVKLFMNPAETISELPVKRFFRYVLQSRPSFDEAGRVESQEASFEKLPSEALLTAAMNVPPAWLVAPQDSAYDLDNIKLSSVKSDVTATYELKHILIEGHSRQGSGAPPSGAQLVLATDRDPLLTDTIIMSNLGFFQFKANPGVYNIQLKEGRSADIYEIESIGARGWDEDSADQDTEIAVMDFQGVTLYPRLRRRPGMEAENVLEASSSKEGSDDGILSKGLKFAEGLFGSGKASKPEQHQPAKAHHADINIFSVASGHLYERMLNIMMVSVMRHTKHTVKFWFIEQFLSPSFKDFIPHLAREYGFEYEMVSFKWPHWLRQQKEKQREIWGYKILFLDVLFPLSLDKVIFVDADQVVRTDMMDLVALDLRGDPYGFAPMCDSRAEMEGFRFWKQGYWERYLKGKPYHISALYVVDLRRFRQLAAGDRLRQQYHALSADPGSLANLDQDLPNHMQFQIPIHSLPQEWLWCETWCSDESLAQARTIDLCNNPQTKEPKLDRARRQVPEWTVYDDEIAALDRRRKGEASPVASGEQIGSGSEPSKAAEANINTRSRKYEEDVVHTKDEL